MEKYLSRKWNIELKTDSFQVQDVDDEQQDEDVGHELNRFPFSGALEWDPSQVSAWYDVSKVLHESVNRIYELVDHSGNNRHLYQSEESRQPKYIRENRTLAFGDQSSNLERISVAVTASNENPVQENFQV